MVTMLMVVTWADMVTMPMVASLVDMVTMPRMATFPICAHKLFHACDGE